MASWSSQSAASASMYRSSMSMSVLLKNELPALAVVALPELQKRELLSGLGRELLADEVREVGSETLDLSALAAAFADELVESLKGVWARRDVFVESGCREGVPDVVRGVGDQLLDARVELLCFGDRERREAGCDARPDEAEP